ncbi:MAG: universal stress protein [Pirellulales bacterium]|nr:universal stress protein [Pirellulales bacterium]
MKVLFGVDGSTSSFAAVKRVAGWLSPANDQLAIYYAVPEVHFNAPADRANEMHSRARKALAEVVFAEAKSYLPEGLQSTAQTIVGERSPGPGLLAAADEIRADLIVIGAHGTGTGRKGLMGAVARAVVHAAHLPVLVHREAEHVPESVPLRILLACDGQGTSSEAATMLHRFTWPAQTVGKVIGVIESMFAGELPTWLEQRARSADAEAMAQVWVREHEAEKQHRQEELVKLCTSLPAPFANQTPIVAEGHAAEQILAAAAAESAGLLVLGARGVGMLGRILLGSTSERVLNHSPCSVLIVRHHHP